MYFLIDTCQHPDILRVLYFVYLLLDIVFVAIPIGLIIMLMIDFSKAVITGEEKEQIKSTKLVTKRIMYAVIIFIIPWVVNVLITFIETVGLDIGGDYMTCITNVEAIRNETKNFEYFDSLLEAEEESEILNNSNNGTGGGTSNDSGETVEDNNSVYFDSYSSGVSCSNKNLVVYSSEPDPSCFFDFWSGTIDVNNFIFPKINGKLLGAWPKKHESISKKLKISKTYQSDKLIWPVTPSNGIYNFVYEHNGIDIMATIGTPIYAPADGILVYSHWGSTPNKGSDETAYSIKIIMDDPIIYNNAKYSDFFLTHMSGIIYRCSSTKECNRRVEKGDLIGFVGNAAGSAESKGWAPHLHMSIHTGNYNEGLLTSKIQQMYGLNCGSGCKNVKIEAGG